MFIRSNVLPIEKVYSGDFQLVLPWFQRAYAWSHEHVSRLVQDLFDAMNSPKPRYSLGHLSLAHEAGSKFASIIDGHQRSISLTILFALLRDLIGEGPVANRLQALIAAPVGGFRLVPQHAIAGFIENFVQSRGATLLDPSGDIMDLSPSERNILTNRDHMRTKLIETLPTREELERFAVFIMEKCVVIVDEVDDEMEARELLRREEETGLSPHSSELAKDTILSAMRSDEQEQAAQLFQSAQIQLSADDMSNLLAHIRLLKARRRSSRAVDGELVQLFKVNKTGLPFIKNELLPRAAAMTSLLRRDIGTGEARQRISRSIDMLYWIDHRLWVPAALHWLAVKGADHDETARFFELLDRMTYMLRIGSVDPTDQELRYLRLLDDIDTAPGVDSMRWLQIERKLLDSALENLRSRTFYAKRCHALVMRRVSVHIDPSRDPGPVDGENVTVEHILPRKPDAGSQWKRDFPGPEDVPDYCHRIGNLAFLTREKNEIAGNSDYLVKAFILAESGSKFVLSARASAETTWTKETIMRRGEELIELLLRPWQLSA